MLKQNIRWIKELKLINRKLFRKKRLILNNIKGACCVLILRVTNCTLTKVLLWIIITFIYFTMNVSIQRILLLSVGIWLICMCSDNIHKLHGPRDRKKWSASPSLRSFWVNFRPCKETLLGMGRVCIRSWMSEYPSVLIFSKAKALYFYSNGSSFSEVILIFWSLQEKAFLWQWMKTKAKDERNHPLKETKRPLQRSA